MNNEDPLAKYGVEMVLGCYRLEMSKPQAVDFLRRHYPTDNSDQAKKLIEDVLKEYPKIKFREV